jgi:hypothetical protein
MQLSLVVLAAVFQAAVSIASTLTPPVIPLVVRNPYLSTWLANARDAPWSKWPMFYTGEEVGLSLMAHLPSQKTVYPLLGKPHESLDDKSEYVFEKHSFVRHLDTNKLQLRDQIPQIPWPEL